MKLRILDDALRLRLDRDEVDALGRGEAVTSTTRFPGGVEFIYQLATGTELAAAFDGGRLQLTIPAVQAKTWASDDTEVSIRGTSGPTQILVEKDFECLEPREGESQSNRFPNPKGLAP